MRFSLSLLLTAPLIAGCAMQSMQVRYAPTSAPRPLAEERKPSIAVAIVDDRVGGIKTPAGGWTKPVSPPLSVAVHDAMELELGRLGFSVSDQNHADAVLETTIQDAALVNQQGGGSVAVGCDLDLVLKFANAAGEKVWQGKLEGRGRDKGIFGADWNIAANAALADAMAKLGPLIEDQRIVREIMDARSGSRKTAASRPEPSPEGPSAARSDIDELPTARPKNPKSYAVVIGIERYREKLPKADFAASDAALAAEYFKRVLGVPEENVALLTDDRATKNDFEKYFERWLPNHAEAGSEVFVYYSGHGAPNPAKGDAYLVPFDGDPTYIDTTGYPLKKMYEQLAKLPARSVTIVMDSCFSGAGGRSVVAAGARPLVSVAQPDVPAKLTVIAASAGNQISNSYAAKGHGLFTYFFLKGMKENGADLRAVYDYLKPQVSKVARREYNADQEPQWRGGR